MLLVCCHCPSRQRDNSGNISDVFSVSYRFRV